MYYTDNEPVTDRDYVTAVFNPQYSTRSSRGMVPTTVTGTVVEMAEGSFIISIEGTPNTIDLDTAISITKATWPSFGSITL